MTEQEWLTSSDPQALLTEIMQPGRRPVHLYPSDRKLRLFACACRLLVAQKSPDVDMSKFDPDLFVPFIPYHGDQNLHDPYTQAVLWGSEPRIHGVDLTGSERAAFLRDIFGNPFQPVPVLRVKVGGNMGLPEPPPHPWLRWNNGTIPALARTIYDERRFENMPVLADALEEAGCQKEDVLRHCRGMQQCATCLSEGFPCAACQTAYLSKRDYGWHPADADNYQKPHGPHVRGCWVLDLLLGNN